MANVDAAFGARPVRHLTGGTVRANEWKIIGDGTSSTAIFTGDFVKLGATGYIDAAAAGNNTRCICRLQLHKLIWRTNFFKVLPSEHHYTKQRRYYCLCV